MKELKYLLSNSKYLLPFLTVLSLINLEAFYNSFDIKIGSFLSIDEYLTPLIDNLLYYFIFLVLFYFLAALFIPNSWKIYNTSRILEKKRLSYLQRLKKDFTEEGFWLLLNLIIWVLLIIQGIRRDNYSLLFLPLTSVALHVRREIIIKHPDILNNHLELLNVFLLMSAFVIFSFFYTFLSVYEIKHNPQKEIRIILSNEEIVCKDSISYIGRVKNYTFIYNQKTKMTTTLNNTDIKNLIIKGD